MTIGVMLLLPIMGLLNVGGFEGLSTSLPETAFDVTSIGPSRIIAYIFLLVPDFLVGQDIWQKLFTAKSPQVARKGTLLASGYIALYAIATVIIGMCIAAAMPGLEDSNLAFATAAATFCPGGVRGLVLAAALASIMSTANGGIIGSATVIYNDMICVVSKKKKGTAGKADDDQNAILTTRILLVVVTAGAVFCAIVIRSVLVALDVAYAYLSGCVFVPLVLAFILKRVSAKAGLASLVGSFLTVTVLFFVNGITSTWPIIIGMIVSIVLFFVVAFIERNNARSIEFDAEDGAVIIDGQRQSLE